MNRRLRQLLTGFIVACAIAVMMPFQMITAFAGSAKISFSDPSASVGKEFNVSVKITASEGDLGSADVVLSYDPAYIEFVSGNNASGGAGSVRLVGAMDSDTTTVFSYNLKFKGIQAGNSEITVASYEVYDKDTQVVDVTKVGSSAVKVAAPSSYSSEAGLSSLKVSPGSLSPAFSEDVTSYTVNVGGDVEKIAVSANAKDGKAKVLVSGDSNLKTGANNVVCKVTAEDGQTAKSYKITVNKSATADAAAGPEGVSAAEPGAVVGELKADIDGTEYSVASSFDPATLPAGYTQSTCIYNGSEIMAGTGNDLTLIYLQDSAGTGSFFIYNPTSGALSPYLTIDVTAKSIVVLPVDDTVTVPAGFAETMIQLNGDFKVKGWVWQSDTEQKYCVVYGMNENGDKGLYRYDIAEKTFQRYFEDPAVQNTYDDAEVENLLNEYQSILKDYNIRFIIIIALIVVCLILFFIVVNLLLRRRERREPPEPRGGGRREESPTPAQRRALEQNSGRSRQTTGSREPRRDEEGSRDPRRDSGESRVPRRESEAARKTGIDVYETRHREEPRVRREEYRDYTVRHEDNREEERKRGQEREDRARQARERLERERREDERRRYEPRPNTDIRNINRASDDDDFEFMDLN